jgi:hypothetical protein
LAQAGRDPPAARPNRRQFHTAALIPERADRSPRAAELLVDALDVGNHRWELARRLAEARGDRLHIALGSCPKRVVLADDSSPGAAGTDCDDRRCDETASRPDLGAGIATDRVPMSLENLHLDDEGIRILPAGRQKANADDTPDALPAQPNGRPLHEGSRRPRLQEEPKRLTAKGTDAREEQDGERHRGHSKGRDDANP